MKKAINFDIDTKKYEKYTGKPAPTAYAEIKNYLKKNGFEHRQGSGYISKEAIQYKEIADIVSNLSLDLKWLQYCVKVLDVTNIEKQHSLINVVKSANKKKRIIDSRIVRHNMDISRRKSDDYER